MVVVKRNRSVVPNVVGGRLPDKAKLESPERQEEYALAAMCLLRGFRNRESFVQGNQSYWDSFNLWRKTEAGKTDFVDSILNNAQDYYEAKRKAKELSENRPDDLADQEGVIDFDNIGDLAGRGGRNEDSDSDSDDGEDDPEFNEDIETDEIAATPTDPAHIVSILNNPKLNALMGNIKLKARRKLFVSKEERKDPEKIAELVEAAINAKRSPQEEVNSPSKKKKNQKSRSLSVEDFDKAINDVNRTTFISPDQLKPYPTIAQVSSASKLNEKQQRSFILCATALLKTWKSFEDDETQSDQFLHILNGEGGVGKSYVIKALQLLASLWGKPSAIKTVAPTGIAAVNVEGSTVHSSLELSIKTPIDGHEKVPPSKGLAISW